MQKISIVSQHQHGDRTYTLLQNNVSTENLVYGVDNVN